MPPKTPKTSPFFPVKPTSGRELKRWVIEMQQMKQLIGSPDRISYTVILKSTFDPYCGIQIRTPIEVLVNTTAKTYWRNLAKGRVCKTKELLENEGLSNRWVYNYPMILSGVETYVTILPR